MTIFNCLWLHTSQCGIVVEKVVLRHFCLQVWCLAKWQCCYTNHFWLSWLHLCISNGFVSVLEIFIFHFVKNKLRSQQHPVNSLHFQSILCEKYGYYEAVFLLHNCCRIRPTELLSCKSWIGNWKGHNLTECVYGYYLPD